jgi:DNA polymerase I-like protein with 3'-5' exonuclease and polymerase domains
MPIQRVFTKAELRGMDIGWQKVDALGEKVDAEIKDLENKIHTLLGTSPDSFNIDSPDQVGLKFQELGFKNYGVGKKGIYSIGEYALNKWFAEDKHEVAGLLINLHGLKTLNNTFIGRESKGTGYFQYKKPDNRIHTNYQVGLTNTGRNASSNPNLTNVPKHDSNGNNYATRIKDFFTPLNEEECAICELDGVSLQLVVEAALSADPEMKRLFTNGVDMHSLTAHMLFGKGEPFEEFDAQVKAGNKKYKKYRQAGKAPNFSVCFNSTAYSFALQSLYQGPYKWDLSQCKEYVGLHDLQHLQKEKYKKLLDSRFSNIDNPESFSYFYACAEDIREKWLNKYSGIKDYIDFKIRESKLFGAVFTPFGFIRRNSRLKWAGKDDDKGIIKNCSNIASNVCAQTWEWWIISKAMIATDDYIETNNMKSQIACSVHDSSVFILYYNEAKKIIEEFSSVFSEDIPENRGLPFRAEGDLGIWGNGISIESCESTQEIKEKVLNKIKKVRKDFV